MAQIKSKYLERYSKSVSIYIPLWLRLNSDFIFNDLLGIEDLHSTMAQIKLFQI